MSRGHVLGHRTPRKCTFLIKIANLTFTNSSDWRSVFFLKNIFTTHEINDQKQLKKITNPSSCPRTPRRSFWEQLVWRGWVYMGCRKGVKEDQSLLDIVNTALFLGTSFMWSEEKGKHCLFSLHLILRSVNTSVIHWNVHGSFPIVACCCLWMIQAMEV